MSRKLWTLLISIMMIVTMIPATVAAEEQGSAQQITKSGDEMLSYENGAVQISKSIRGTDTENKFEVTLKATTSENMEQIKTVEDAAVVLVVDRSTSMGDEIENSQNGETKYQVAIQSAQNFVEEFGKDAEGSKRLVQIVQFAHNVHKKASWNWENVADASGLQECKADIDSIDEPGGATSIEGGLQMAYNILDAAKADGSLEGISNVNVILLTDAFPNFHVIESSRTSTEYIGGKMGGGTWSEWEDHDTITRDGGVADKIKGLEVNGSNVSLYSVGLSTGIGKFAVDENNVFEEAKDQDVYEWLGYFSDKTYKAENLQELYDSFASIVETIKSGTKAWRIYDPMAENIIYEGEDSSSEINSYTFSDNKLVWDLQKSEAAVETVGNTTSYTYTLTYPVTLDTTGEDFEFNTGLPTNGDTVLEYYLYSETGNTSANIEIKQVNFEVPEVKGLAGTLKFTKVDENDSALEGAEFTLEGTTTGTDKEVTMTSVSDKNGKVVFDRIPAGEYTLTETKVPEGYTGDNNEYNVVVSYGKISGDIDENTRLINTNANGGSDKPDPGEGDEDSPTVKTGDNFNMWGYIVLALIAALGAGAAVFSRRRQNQ